MADARKNFATSFVATAPSPATSGTSLVVAAGEGARFATPPFNAVIAPSDAEPTPANAEVVRVTGISTDTFTITRAQESSVARSVIVGDAIYAGVTKKTLDDMDTAAVPGYQPSYISAQYYAVGLSTLSGAGTGAMTTNRVYFLPFVVEVETTFDRIATYITANGGAGTVARLGVFNNSGGKPGTVLFDAGTVATDAGAAAIKAITISQTIPRGLYWSAISPQVTGTTATYRRVLPVAVSAYMSAAFDGNVLAADSVTGAFASTPGVSPLALNPPICALRAH